MSRENEKFPVTFLRGIWFTSIDKMVIFYYNIFTDCSHLLSISGKGYYYET